MLIKDILVLVDSSSSCEARLETAGRLAKRLNAYLIGVGIEDPFAEQQFATQLERSRVPGEWRVVSSAEESDFLRRARAADLIVLGQHDRGQLAGLKIPEEVILACGRPVVVVPRFGHFAEVGRKVLVAWNGSREVTRAVHDALPLLTQSDAVTLLAINPGEAGDRGNEMVDHLTRHGLSVAAETVETTTVAVADVMLPRAGELGVDLIVMGAYGRGRWSEKIFGGVTQDMLGMMTVPVLMAH